MQRAQNGLNQIFETLARMPWWGGIVLAFLGFVMLHPFAIMDVAAAPLDGDAGLTSKQFWRNLAATGQYVIPAILLVAPGVAGLIARLGKSRSA